MMTYKSTQGNSCTPNENDEKYEEVQELQESQGFIKKRRKRRPIMRDLDPPVPPPIELPPSSNAGVVRSETHHEVARTTTVTSSAITTATFTIEKTTTSTTETEMTSSSPVNVPLVPVMPPMVCSRIPAYYAYGYPYALPPPPVYSIQAHRSHPSFNIQYLGVPVAVYNHPRPVLHRPMYRLPGRIIRVPIVPQPYVRRMMPPPPPPRVHVKETPPALDYENENIANTSVEQLVPTLDVTSDSSAPTEANLSSEALMYDTSTGESPPETEDPLEAYLLLSRKSFPPATTLPINPNRLIDELCILADFHKQVPWLLDLEFGIPKGLPVTRAIPIYNVGYNSINCKNTPNAIHPGFESCSDSFKRALRFYYDSVISVRYNSFMKLYQTASVDSFQEWLNLGMQTYGMCWP